MTQSKRRFRRLNPRCWSNDELRRIAAGLPGDLSILNAGGWADSDKEGSRYRDYFASPSTYHIGNYPGDEVRGANAKTDLELDLSKPLDPDLDGAYDLVLSHTVLEHVPDPGSAFENLARLSGKYLVTVVPFKQKLHFIPGQFGDYYRFTPFAMRDLYAKNGFEVAHECFTPRPALDVYLIHVGTRSPGEFSGTLAPPVPLESLNQELGRVRIGDLIYNSWARLVWRVFGGG